MNYRIAIIFLLITGMVKAQEDVKEVFLKLNKTYEELQEISMKVNYSVFSDHTTGEPLQAEQGEIIRVGDAKYSKIGPMEHVVRPDYFVIVDHELKRVAMGKRMIGIDDSFDEKGYLKMFGELIDHCESKKYTDVSRTIGQWELVFPGGVFKSFRIYFNKKKWLITGLDIFYNVPQDIQEDVEDEEPPRLTIRYTDIKTKNVGKEEEIGYTRFLKKEGNKYTPIGSYQDYQVHLNL